MEKIKTGNNFVKGARDLTEASNALKELTPIRVETLKAFFPETIYSMTKTKGMPWLQQHFYLWSKY